MNLPLQAQFQYEGELIPKPSIHKTAAVNYLRILDNGVLLLSNSGKPFAFDGNKFFQIDANEDGAGLELANLSAICKTKDGKLLASTLNDIYQLDSNFYFKKVDKLNRYTDQHYKMEREEFSNFTIYHFTNYWNLSLEFAKVNRTSGYFMKSDSLCFYNNGNETFIQRVKMLPQGEISNGMRMFLFTSDNIHNYYNGKLIKEFKDISYNGQKIKSSDIYRVFYCNKRYYILGRFGLAKLKVTEGMLTAYPLLDSSNIRNTSITDLAITKDEKIIYFSSDSGLYRYSLKWSDLYTPDDATYRSSNSLLQQGSYIYSNRGGKFTLNGKWMPAPESRFEYYGRGYAYDKFGNFYYRYGDSAVVRDSAGRLLNWGKRHDNFCSYVPDNDKVYLILFDTIYEQSSKSFRVSRFKLPDYKVNAYYYGGVFYKDFFFVCGTYGIVVYNKRSGKRLTYLEKINDPVFKVQVAPNLEGVFIFTFGSGIWFFDGVNYKRLPNDKENHLNVAHSLRVDRQGRAWIPTNSAMIVCKYEAIQKYLFNQGPAPEYTIVKEVAGIRDPEFNGRSDSSNIQVALDSSFWYCSIYGIIKVMPERFSTKQFNGSPMIVRTIVDGNAYPGFYLPAGHHQQYRMELLIPAASKSFAPRVEFSLNGDEWVEAENGQIQFARSKAGEQELILRYKLNSIDNFYTYRKYVFTIDPLWYETLWAKLFGVVAIFFMFGLILKLREYRLIKRQTHLKNVVREKTKALSESLEELSNSQLQLQESDAFKERLIRVLAHDIRSPLMSAFYVSEYMQKQLEQANSDPELVAMSREVKQVVKSLHDYSNDFIAWYNLMRGNSKITNVPLSLKETLLAVLKFYESSFKSSGNTIRLLGLEQEEIVFCDHHILQIIFRNLIDNANKYSNKSEVKIAVEVLDESINICFINYAQHLDDKRKSEMLESLSQEPGLLVPIEGQKLGLTMLNYFCKKLDLNLSLRFSGANQVIFCITLKKVS